MGKSLVKSHATMQDEDFVAIAVLCLWEESEKHALFSTY